MSAANRVRAFIADWRLAVLLQRRCRRHRDEWLIERRADRTLWAAGHPQNMAYAMRGSFGYMLVRDADWHFYRVRIWHGVPVASPRVFWIPTRHADFRLVERTMVFTLPPWPEVIECMKIDAVSAGQLRAQGIEPARKIRVG